MSSNPAQPPATHSHALLLPVAVALALALLFVRDAPWICDEPLLIHNALEANAQGQWATHGLTGTQGVQYGPLPTWLYQAFLRLSHDMVLLVAVRAAAFITLIGTALICIHRVTDLTGWGLPLLLFSPSIWFYSRLTWDNSFCIPLSAAAIACYLLFLVGKRWAIGGTIVACGAMLIVHLMSGPLIAAIALHALIFRRRELWRERWTVLIALAVVVLAGVRYWPILTRGLSGDHGTQFPGWAALRFSLAGGSWLGGTRLVHFVGEDWLAAAPAVLRLAILLSGVLHILVAAGACLAARHVYRVLRGTHAANVLFHMAFVCFAMSLIQFVYFGMRGAVDQPHYYNASWFAYGFFAWLSLDWLARHRIGNAACMVVLSPLPLVVLLLLTRLHATHGTRSLAYGPTLGNQIAVANMMATRTPQTRVSIEIPTISMLPQRLLVLERLRRESPVPGPHPALLHIRYRSTHPADGAIVIDVALSPSSPDEAAATQSAPITR